ncbi:MAG TPA: SDR family oxidoreductase [Steroidobacteraceae bacterium]|jgi:NAD(P)-dependent dehydrogenase (short-subunit alcohol dehydrogenase family)|nr:SDR family oxidoreductase [Steroidobacteraceae bacterium]
MGSRSKVVLVTGASSGLGHAIAKALTAKNHRVFGTVRSGRGGESENFTTLPLDVTQDESVAACIAEIIRAAGRIDAVVNNAGCGIAGAIEDTTAAEALSQFETNFFGTHRVCRAVLPHLRAQRAGIIINMSSLAGRIPLPFQGFYSATKFAIEAYTEALRMEVRRFGISVSMIEPGDFATSFTANRRMTKQSIPASPYYESAVRAIATMARDEQANRDLSPVIEAVESILESRRPALRYPRANALQRTFNALHPFLPQAIAESLIRSTYGLR